MSGHSHPHCNLTGSFVPAIMNLDEMFPNLEHQLMPYVLQMCGLRDIPSQTWFIDHEGFENIKELANYTDTKLDTMADCNSKRSSAPTRVQMGLAHTKKLKAVNFWIRKKLCENAPCDLTELTVAFIGELFQEMSLMKSSQDSDSKLYYPNSFTASDYKNWIKNVSNYMDLRKANLACH
jgi:hypothetical protein